LAVWVGIRGGRRIEGFAPDLSEPAANFLALLTIFAILGFMAFIATRGASATETDEAGDSQQ
jgi:hypothetical protein